MPWMIDHPQLAGRSTRRRRRRSSAALSCPHPPWNLIKTHHTFWYGYGSIPINTIFSGMNIHLPAILMFTRGTRFWHTTISICDFPCLIMDVCHCLSSYLFKKHITTYLWKPMISGISSDGLLKYDETCRSRKHQWNLTNRFPDVPRPHLRGAGRWLVVRCDWHIASPCFNQILFWSMGSTRLVSTSGRQIFRDFGTIFRHVAPGEACISKRKNRKSPRNAEASWWQTHHPPWGIRIIQTPQYPRKGCFDGETDDKPWNLLSALF